MTDDDRPRYCNEHRWGPPQPVWTFNAAGELVPHPTARLRLCVDCPAEMDAAEVTP